MKKSIMSLIMLLLCINAYAGNSNMAVATNNNDVNTPQENQNITLAKNALVELNEKGDIAALKKYYSENFQLIRGRTTKITTREELDKYLQKRKSIVKSVKITPFRDAIAKGDKVVLLYDYKIVNFDGETKTGKAVAISQIKDNKIYKMWLVHEGLEKKPNKQ